MKESFLTVLGEYSETTVIEKSKFICYLKHIESEDEAKEFIASKKKYHYEATHNCSAFIADSEGNLSRFADDGEPSGTAGMPMLDALKGKGVYEVVAVVTRYFGGIKLGAGGLVRAYSGCVSSALNNAKIVEKSLCKVVKLTTEYDKYSLVLKMMEGFNGGEIIGQDFGNEVNVIIAIKNSYYGNFLSVATETFLGKQKITELYTDYLILKGKNG